MSPTSPQPHGLPSGSFGRRPRSLTAAWPPASLLRLPIGLVMAGWLVAAFTVASVAWISALGLALAAVGQGMAAGLIGLSLAAAPGRGHGLQAWLPPLALLAGAVLLWAAAVALALGQLPLVQQLMPVGAGLGAAGVTLAWWYARR